MVSAVVIMKVVFAAVALVVVALSSGGGAGVSAQTHHIVGGGGGWGPAFNVSSWLSGRVFKVGDKIWFNYSGTEDSIVELQNMEEFVSCNFTNPIRMYTDPTSHVSLEEEGVRYFASGNQESCTNGLKLPVPIQPSSEFGPHHSTIDPSPEFDPSEHFEPDPEFDPSEHFEPAPEFGPPEPFEPTPEFGPPEPVEPFGPPEHEFGPPPPLPIPTPAAATHLNGLSVVLIAALLSYYVGCHFY
ncbi:hypothetical protein ACP275_13G135500 [Erythranthe tilingii]